MQPTRRDLLRLGGATLLASGATVPLFLARSAAALGASHASAARRVLVVVQLDGGNDGLNTVIPYHDDEYHKRRRHLRIRENLRQIDDHVAFHPALDGLSAELQAGRLAVVQSVGYPNPNRSHFESMAIWHTGRLLPASDQPGWIARYLDGRPLVENSDAAAFNIDSGQLPGALAGTRWQVPSLTSLEQFRRRIGIPKDAGVARQRAALDLVNSQPRCAPGPLLEFVQRNTARTYASAARLEGMPMGPTAPTGHSDKHALSQRLRLIAQLIKAGLSTSIYYTQLGSFDTHANQLDTHWQLLHELGESLHAFLDDLHRSGEGERVLVLIFSEFGRRLSENGSRGTDHGTAGPVFVLGPAVRAGLHGPYPNLHDLDDGGDPKHAIDFRQIYATLLEQWLGCPSQTILGKRFTPLGLIADAQKR
jgi:uncharacterized protein (DUF1501 family)